MISSKQRSYLRSLANNIEAVIQVGKGGVTPELTKSVDEVLEKRELVKLSILNNCMEEPKEVADILSGRTRSEVIQVIGKKIVLFRQSKKKPTIDIDSKSLK